MNWFWLTITYLILLTSATLINKKSLNNLNIDEIVYGASIQLATSGMSLFLALLTGWNFVFNSASTPLFIGMGITYFFAISCYYTGLKKTELSVAAILDSTGSIYSLILGALLLNEPLLLNKLIGIAFIIAAVLIVSLKNKGSSFNKYSWILLFSAFFYALGAIFDKKLNTFGNPLSYLTLSFATAGIFMFLINFKRTKIAFKETFRNKNFWVGISINGILYSLGFWALFEAYNRGGEVSRMFPITLSMSVIIPILGIIFLKERDNIAKKLIAIVIMILGLWILGSV
jgi:drug/metabolite transporter (DMT)-like permease